MKLLLDTHVLLWALLEPQKLSPELRNALEDRDNTLLVSAATAWEVAIVENDAMALHRLAAVELPISAAVARQAGPRDAPHRDPLDRLLATPAQANYFAPGQTTRPSVLVLVYASGSIHGCLSSPACGPGRAA